MDFKDLARVIRRRWRIITVAFSLCVIASAAMSLTATRIYESTSRIFISNDVSTSADAYLASFFASSRVDSYAQLATSSDVMQLVINDLHLDLTPNELASEVTATVPKSTVMVLIGVNDPSQERASRIAQSVATQLSSYIGRVETPNGKDVAPVKATITDVAQPAGEISPRTSLNLAVGALVGLLLGCALALLRDLFDTTIKSAADVEAITAAPVLAHVAFDPSIPRAPLFTQMGSHTSRAEAFRLLRTNLQFVDLDSAPKSFVVTSALPGEGKTSTSANLAIALAQTGKRVLLIDGDLRRPRLADMLGLENAVGLTTVLVGRSTLNQSLQHHADTGIDLLASGPLPPNPTEILQSQVTRTLLSQLRDRYDAVVIDAPPLLPVADAAILSNEVAGALVVVRHGRTTREQLRHALGRIDHVGGRTFGILVNMSPRRRTVGYGDTYGYGYGYGYEPTPDSRPTS